MAQAKFANRNGVPYQYILDPPFPPGTSSETVHDFLKVMQKEWSLVIEACNDVPFIIKDSSGKILWSR